MSITKNILTILPLLLIISSYGYGQNCNPPGADDCESSNVLCGLSEMNGLACSTPKDPNPTGPLPSLCFGTGESNNTRWWAFVGSGELVEVTFNTAYCEFTGTICTGIQAGIVVECDGDPLDCNAACNTSNFTLSGVTQNCHTYYVWVDGCCGDVCNYKVSVGRGKVGYIPLPLPEFEVRGALCKCNTVEVCSGDLKGGCTVPMRWTIDGVDAPEYNDLQCIPYPVPDHDVEFCMTWILGNPANPDAICDEQTKCFTLSPPDTLKTITLSPEVVCPESHRQGYTWQLDGRDTVITSSCVDPPCTWLRRDTGDCCILYEKSIRLLPKRKTGQRFILACNDSAFVAEDSTRVTNTICGIDILWQDSVRGTDMVCDTTYTLVYERLAPRVSIVTDTFSGHGGSLKISPSSSYRLQCLPGELELSGFWVINGRDTVWQDTLLLSGDSYPRGQYEYYLNVVYTDSIHPESGLQCNYFTGKTLTLNDCFLYRPLAKDIRCSDKDLVRFDLDFSWMGKPGDSFYVSSGQYRTNGFALADLPVRIMDFPISEVDSVHPYWVCTTGGSKCCVAGQLTKDCSKISSLDLSSDASSIYYAPFRRRLHMHVPLGAHSYRLEIYDLNGKPCLSAQELSGNASYDVRRLSRGIFIAILTDKNGVVRATVRFFHP